MILIQDKSTTTRRTRLILVDTMCNFLFVCLTPSFSSSTTSTSTTTSMEIVNRQGDDFGSFDEEFSIEQRLRGNQRWCVRVCVCVCVCAWWTLFDGERSTTSTTSDKCHAIPSRPPIATSFVCKFNTTYFCITLRLTTRCNPHVLGYCTVWVALSSRNACPIFLK